MPGMDSNSTCKSDVKAKVCNDTQWTCHVICTQNVLYTDDQTVLIHLLKHSATLGSVGKPGDLWIIITLTEKMESSVESGDGVDSVDSVLACCEPMWNWQGPARGNGWLGGKLSGQQSCTWKRDWGAWRCGYRRCSSRLSQAWLEEGNTSIQQ